jgi:hypothetical protein
MQTALKSGPRSAPANDAPLLNLRRELEAASAALSAMEATASGEEFEAAYYQTASLARVMLAHKATTIAGLQAKAVAIRWCRGEDDDEDLLVDDNKTTDLRLANSLLDDLLAIDT